MLLIAGDNKTPILSVFQLMLLENMVMCRLVTGNKSQALREMSQVCSICQRHPRLLNSHRPQLHMLIGLYAMSMNCMDAAEMQFTTSLRVGILFIVKLILNGYCIFKILHIFNLR